LQFTLENQAESLTLRAMEEFNAALDENLQRETQKRAATKRRIKVLAILAIGVGVTRIFVKPPPPPPKPVHENAQIKIMPGMLARMPEAEKAKLSPETLAKLQEADRNPWKGAPAKKDEDAIVHVPTHTPVVVHATEEMKQELTALAKRQPKVIKHSTPLDPNKSTLVRLNNGRHLRVAKASKTAGGVEIFFDQSIVARVPARMVASVSQNALSWKEPVPAGYRRLTPAKGITIQVSKDVAKRISITETGHEI
jgi:hypothetical protein